MSNAATLMTLMDLYARTTAPDYLNNRLRWLNEAQRSICRLEKWWFTQHECAPVMTSSGVSEYTLDAPMAFITGVWRGAVELHPFDVGSRPLIGETPGPPTYYRQSAGAADKIVVAPTPDAGPYSLVVRGHRFLADLVDAGSTNALVVVAPYALVFGAMIEAALHLGRDPAIWKARQDAHLLELRESNARRGRSAG